MRPPDSTFSLIATNPIALEPFVHQLRSQALSKPRVTVVLVHNGWHGAIGIQNPADIIDMERGLVAQGSNATGAV